MRTSFAAIVVVAGLICALPAVRGDDTRQAVSKAEVELEQARRLIAELQEEVKGLNPSSFTFSSDERYIDANVYFDLKHYDKCALLLTSLMEDGRFKTGKRYYDGMKLLGIALYNLGNLQGAHKYFTRLVTAGAFKDVALTYLVEIAARLGRDEELVRLAEQIPDSGTDSLIYAKGKALLLIGRNESAVDVLRRVPGDTNDGLRARYLSGAALVSLKRHDDAMRVYQGLIKVSPANSLQEELQHLSFLALGRLSYEKEDFSAAADYYQMVPRKSRYFERALYEVTHVHLQWAHSREDVGDRIKSYARAEELLDILVSISENPDLEREARILRGRISMYLEKYEQAREAYQEVIEQFASTSSELSDIAQSPESVQKFFEAMIRGGDSARELNLFASAEVVKWMRVQPQLGRVVDVLSDVASQRTTLAEAREIYKQLMYSLSQEAARELFPGFSDAWLKSLEIENRLLEADGLLLGYEGSLAGGYLDGAAKKEAGMLEERRRKLNLKLATAPRTVGGYRARGKATLGELRTIGREVDKQILRIERNQEQILAMRKLLNEVKYKGSRMLQVKDEKRIMREVVEEGERLLKLMTEAERLRAAVEKEMLVVEVGDPMTRGEQDIKGLLWKQHGEEASFYIDRRDNMKPSVQQAISLANTKRREILRLLSAVRSEREKIDEKAQRQIRMYRKTLAREKTILDQRERELRDTEEQAIRFARGVGSSLFLKAKEGLVKAVVEADLGIVDLAWKRTQIETQRIAKINAERGKVVKKLRDELNAVMIKEQEKE